MPPLAKRLDHVPVAASVQMTIRARELRAVGHNVIPLTIGEPDFATPQHAIEAARQAALRGETKYPPHDGTPALKQAVQRKFARENGLDYPLDQICVTNGGKQAIFNTLMATVDPGDEVVIPAPYWGAYPQMARFTCTSIICTAANFSNTLRGVSPGARACRRCFSVTCRQ